MAAGTEAAQLLTDNSGKFGLPVRIDRAALWPRSKQARRQTPDTEPS
jgi:hypothetical protein